MIHNNNNNNDGGGDKTETENIWGSFHRNDAHIEAKGCSDTWESLTKQTKPLLKEIRHASKDLYDAKNTLRTSIFNCHHRGGGGGGGSNIHQMAKSSKLKKLSTKISQENASALLKILTKQLERGEEEQEQEIITFQLTREEVIKMRLDLYAWIKGRQQLHKNYVSAIKVCKVNINIIDTLEEKVKQFIYNLWAFMAERGKAFPPFFDNLGPLQASLYGMGRLPADSPKINHDHDLGTTTSKPDGGGAGNQEA